MAHVPILTGSFMISADFFVAFPVNQPPTGPLADAGTGGRPFVSQDPALGPIWMYAFLIAIGLAAALAALVYFIKLRQKPLAMAQAVAGGGFASTLVAILGPKLPGLETCGHTPRY